MGFTSPLHNVRGYSVSKPPVTIFVICLILCASATLAMGFFIQYAETILNPEVKEKWLSFLNHLIAMDFCVFEGNEEMDIEAVTQFIDGGIVNSTGEVSITLSVSVHLVSELKKLPSGMVAAYGNVPVGDWAFFQDTDHPLTSLKMAHVVPPDLTESSNKSSCLILTVPSSFLPLSTRSSVCIPSFVNKTITHVGTISIIKPNGSNPACKNGAYLKLNYNQKSEQNFYLSKLEKQNVYLRLVRFSYFLFAVTVALICFSFLRTKTYTSVVTLDKDMGADDFDDLLPDKVAAKEFYAKYEPKEILGRGISSTVRKCIEKETGKEFAAKIIDLSCEGNRMVGDCKTTLETTIQEVHILRMVAGHPYIVELHDVFESSTFIFLVFELCRNGELFDYLTSVVALSEKKTRYIMRQIFEGLDYIHSKNIVHRDLKPENILLDDAMNVKITDFGFARILKENERLLELCGTPGYLAPETLKASMFDNTNGYGKEVDIWACGVIMFTLLVGCPPFWHRKQMVMLRNIMEGKYSFSSPEWADITEPPKDLIRKLLVLDPKKRITIKEAMNHPFFQVLLFDQDIAPLKRSLSGSSRRLSKISQMAMELKTSTFNPRKKLRYALICIQAIVRLRRIHLTPEPLSLETAILDPYHIKVLRKVIDGCAFRVYGHWVKKGEGQNRAALFENFPKTELKQLYLHNLSR